MYVRLINGMLNQMKKILTAFMFFAAMIFPQAAQAATLSVSPSTGTINKGCTFSVNIELDTQGTQTDGSDVILFYEPQKLSATINSIVNGKIYQDYPGNSVDSSGGKISISGISSVATPFNGKGTFATINFQVIDSAQGNSTTLKFDFDPNDKTKTTDTNVVERGTIADVLSQVTDGAYTIGTGTCGSTAQSAATSTAGSQGAPGSALLPQGAAGDSSGSALYRPSSLPQSGFFENTLILASVGVVLVLLGAIGLVIL